MKSVCSDIDPQTGVGRFGPSVTSPLPSSPHQFSPLGPTRLRLSKPVIGAIQGNAVAGGLELALWCDVRVASPSSTFGVYCRRFGVPLVDGGTLRLPRVVGHGRAMDMILTGRGVGGREALEMGLVNRLVETGDVVEEAVKMAETIAAFPQDCLRADRRAAIEQWGMSEDEALANEFELGKAVLGEAVRGAARFANEGRGKGGSFDGLY